MIPHRRSPRRGQVWAVTVLATVVVACFAHPGAAAPVADSPHSVATPTRVEGQLSNISGNTWLVDQTTVVLDQNVTLVEVNGKAQVGAWVAVWGDHLSGYVLGKLIHVLRPAGSPAPIIQFTGVLRKIAPPYWVIDDSIVIVDPNTQMDGQPRLGSQLSVTAHRVEWDLVAANIAVLAVDAASVPFEIEGTLEQIMGLTWIVDGTRIRIPPEINLPVRVGDWVEIRALAARDGTLVARDARIVDRSFEAQLDGYVTDIDGLGQANQTWSVLVFDDGRLQTKTVQISADTYVDEDRTVLKPEIEAIIGGSKVDAAAVKADLVRLEQPTPAQAAGALTEPGTDGLWAVGGQQVWFESKTMIAQATSAQSAGQPDGGGLIIVKGVRLRNGVLIAKEVTAGDSESLTASATVVDAAPWSMPAAIVPGLTKASLPGLLFGPDRAAHLIYESDGAIYHAMQPAGSSWGNSKKIATGTSPSASFDSMGRLHVAYVNEFMGNFDIYHVRRDSGAWTLPVNISTTSGMSADPSIATDGAGTVYVAWMDTSSGKWTIHTGTWKGVYWTSYPVSNARGQSPALAVLPDGGLFLAWQDRQPTSENAWGNYDIYASAREDIYWNLPVNVSDNAIFSPGSDAIGVSVVTTRDGLAHLAWINDGEQVRYNPGRGQYWPEPVDVGERRSMARGLSMRLSQEGMLNMAWDEGTTVRIVSAPPAATIWPEAEVLSAQAGGMSDVSLTTAGSGLAVVWIHSDAAAAVGIYESRLNISLPMLVRWLPLIANP